MKIGLTSIFAFRPHVEHMIYLAGVLRSGGHDVTFFSCDAAAEVCYNKLLKEQGLVKGCGSCILGGLHSYGAKPHFSASSSYRIPLNEEKKREISKSSSYTLRRVETTADFELPEVLETQRSLYPSIETIYGSVRKWIRDEKSKGFCFSTDGWTSRGRFSRPRKTKEFFTPPSSARGSGTDCSSIRAKIASGLKIPSE